MKGSTIAQVERSGPSPVFIQRFENSDKLLRMRKRKRPQKSAFNDAKDRAVCSDAEGERQNGDDGEARRLDQHADSEFEVSDHKIPNPKTQIPGNLQAPNSKVRGSRALLIGKLLLPRNLGFGAWVFSFATQCLHWIDKCSATRGQQTREERSGGKQDGRAAEQRRVVGRNLVELRGDQTTERKRRNDSDCQANHDGSHPLINNQSQHVARLGAERHSDADFTCSLLHRVSNRAIDADAGEQERDSGEYA